MTRGREISSKEKWCTEMARIVHLALLVASLLLVGCSAESPEPQEITLATTTSTQDSGLLDVLLPAFEQESGIKVKVVAVGSGQALELGRRGDADVLLTHAPEGETKFMNEGWGTKRLAVMHNDFVVLGPAKDSAGIKSAPTASDAFELIAETRSIFVSRGDESGTHQKELNVWKKSGITPDGAWYIRAGTGMAQALRMAHEKEAYLLCDRATYLALKNEVQLVVLFEGDELLLNRYSVIIVSPEKHPHVHVKGANRWADFLISSGGQKIIGDFGVDRYGQSLFVPDASSANLD
jgi:tungstate transport system substrate-binding protein